MRAGRPVVEVTAATHRGCVRETNEDALCINDVVVLQSPNISVGLSLPADSAAAPVLCALADGLGGHQGGALAGRLAVEAVAQGTRSADLSVESRWSALIDDAHDEMVRLMDVPEYSGMGATLVAAVATGDDVLVVNVGDSRAYLFTDGYLVQVSTDDALTDPGLTHVVTQSLGGSPEASSPRPHVSRVSWGPGAAVLLCSDGLSDLVPLDDIERLAGLLDGDVAVRELVAAALAAGGRDNVTVVLMRHRTVPPAGGVTDDVDR